MESAPLQVQVRLILAYMTQESFSAGSLTGSDRDCLIQTLNRSFCPHLLYLFVIKYIEILISSYN